MNKIKEKKNKDTAIFSYTSCIHKLPMEQTNIMKNYLKN